MEKTEKEIDLLELGKKLWDNKKFIIKCTVIGIILGLIIAFSIPKEYTSSVIFTTDSNKSAVGGNMGALASLAGINLGNMNTSDIFSPELYPSIIESTSFIEGLLDIEVKDRNQEFETTLYIYLKEKQKKSWWNYTLGIPRLAISLFKSDKEVSLESTINSYFISNEKMKIIEIMKDSYSITTNKKTGVTTFDITSQSPIISAFLADTITSYLQLYIIEERTKKAKMDLENSRKLYQQYKEDYDKSQTKLSSFLDRNKNIISETYRFNQRKLENEANLAYAVYNKMAQQVQMNEIKVQDETPVFTIIQPAIQPINASAPQKTIILIVFILISIICSCGWLLRRDLLSLI